MGTGTINIGFSKKKTAMLLIPVGLLLLFAAFIAVSCLWSLIIDFSSFIYAMAVGNWLIYLGMIAVPVIFAVIMFRMIRQGNLCRYKATGREFVITRKDKTVFSVLYKDVKDVTYKPTKLFWIDTGYEVTISTRSYDVKLNYVFPGHMKHTIKTRDLPFEIIRTVVTGEAFEVPNSRYS